MSITEEMPESAPHLMGETEPVQAFTLTREAANKLTPTRRFAYVPVPELAPGARARVQNLNSTEISAYEASNFTGMGKKTRLTLENADARLVAFGWVDDSGTRLYNPREADEVRRIGMMDGAPVTRMAKKIRELSGMVVVEDDDEAEEGTEPGKGKTTSD
jgi:hypothetical protein